MIRKLLEKRVFWKIYAFIFAFGIVQPILTGRIQEYILIHGIIYATWDVVAELVTATAIFLFCFRKRWLAKQFWKAWTIAYIIHNVFMFKALPQNIQYAFTNNPFPMPYWVYALIMFISVTFIILPAIICLFLYAFREE